MRIAIVTTNFPVLSETFIVNKVKALAARGHIVKVFTNKQNRALFDELFVNSISVSVAEFTILKAALYSLFHPIQLFKTIIAKKNIKRHLYLSYRLYFINKFKPQITHFEFSGIALEFLPLISKLTCRSLVSCRGTSEKVKILSDKKRSEQMINLFDAMDAIHCVSADMQQTVLPFCKHTSKLFINFPSIDAQYFSPNRTNSDSSQPIILSIGRLIFQKGYLIGLLAIRELKQAGINLKWLIVGDGTQYEELVFHIHQMSLQKHVELLGPKSRDEIKELMHSSNIFFLPSVYEGIANVVLEAMSMEMPVVSTNCSGMSEVITCGKDGLLADVYDYKSLAKQILYLIHHPEQARSMGKAARSRILETFTLEQQTNTFERIYKQLLTD